MDIVQELRERYRLDPSIQHAADEIEQLRKTLAIISEQASYWSHGAETIVRYVEIALGSKE